MTAKTYWVKTGVQLGQFVTSLRDSGVEIVGMFHDYGKEMYAVVVWCESDKHVLIDSWPHVRS